MTNQIKDNHTPCVRESFLDAIGRIVSTVAVIAAADASGRRTGMTATAVTSLSADPPALLICLNKSTHTQSVLIDAGQFSVNFLSEDQRSIADGFAASAKDSDDADAAFSKHGNWLCNPDTGLFLQDALVSFNCTVRRCIDAGSHYVIFGDVMNLASREERTPLLYGARAYQRRPELI